MSRLPKGNRKRAQGNERRSSILLLLLLRYAHLPVLMICVACTALRISAGIERMTVPIVAAVPLYQTRFRLRRATTTMHAQNNHVILYFLLIAYYASSCNISLLYAIPCKFLAFKHSRYVCAHTYAHVPWNVVQFCRNHEQFNTRLQIIRELYDRIIMWLIVCELSDIVRTAQSKSAKRSVAGIDLRYLCGKCF